MSNAHPIQFYLGLVLGVSLFLTIMSASFVGVFIPWMLHKFKKDPAVGAGPFGAIIQDVMSIVMYFIVATTLLNLL